MKKKKNKKKKEIGTLTKIFLLIALQNEQKMNKKKVMSSPPD